MKHQTISSNSPSLNEPEKVLLIGDFKFGTSSVCTDLAVSLLRSGAKLHTASFWPNHISQYHLNFRTKLKSTRSTAFLEKYDHIILFEHSCSSAPFLSKSRWKQLKEWRRRQEFLRSLPKRTLKLTKVRDEVKYYASHKALIKNDLSDLGKIQCQNMLLDHSVNSQTKQHLSIQHLLSIAKIACPNDLDLQKIYTLVKTRGIRQHPLIKRLMHAPCTPVFRTDSPYPIQATALDKIGKNSRYAEHLKQLFLDRENDGFRFASKRPDHIEWYNTEAQKNLLHRWVPLLSTENQNDPLRSLFQDPTKWPQCEPQLRTILECQKHPDGPNGLAIVLALLCRIPTSVQSMQNPWRSTEIKNWFHDHVCVMEPAFAKGMNNQSGSNVIPKRCEILGFQNQNNGLSTNAKMSSDAFQSLGIAHAKIDVTVPGKKASVVGTTPKQSFALHHVNAERVPLNIVTPQYFHRNDVFHIGYFLWESSRLPKIHHLGIHLVDEIWAPSKFVANLYEQVSTKHVEMIGKSLPQLAQLKRIGAKVQPDPNYFTVFTAFDFHSSLERKNPMALVHGFQKAFPKKSHPHARLILKSTNMQPKHWGDPMGQQKAIRTAKNKDKRITLIEQTIPQSDLFRLMAHADCVASTHRGEGFGYLPAYAHAMGRTVMATDWGGNTDFCNDQNSYPLPYSLVEIPKNHSIFNSKGAQWADVHTHDIAHQLRRIYDDIPRAKKLAKIGQENAQSQFDPKGLTVRYKARLETLGLI